MGRRRKGGPPRGSGRLRADVRVDRWLRGAFDAHRARNLREAEKLAQRVLDAVADQPDALHLLATVARETGRTDLAIDLYRRLLRRHPAIPIAHNSLGNLLQERDRWQEAIACYEAALAHDSRYTSAYFNLGRALLHMNDLVRAEHYLRQAGGARPERRPGPSEARPCPRRAGQAGGGTGRDAPLRRARPRLAGHPERCRGRPCQRRRLRHRPRTLSRRAQPREVEAFHRAA